MFWGQIKKKLQLVAIDYFLLITTVPVCGEEKSWARYNQKDYKMYGFSCYKRSYYMMI